MGREAQHEQNGVQGRSRDADAQDGGTSHWFGRFFYACGNQGLPRRMDCLGRSYRLVKVLKHDFVAGTGLYETADTTAGSPRRLVCKVNRRTFFLLLPMGWLGRLVTHNEVFNLRRCEGIRGVPKVLARPAANVYVYEFIEGVSLAERPSLPGGFFDELIAVLRQIHGRNLVHFDLHKPGNILLGSDGRPHIIDFQLSTHVGERLLLSRRLSARLRRRLQGYDIYHLYKHKRRLAPGELTEAEERLSRNNSLPLRIHRAIATPLRRARRACLRYLHARGILARRGAEPCEETDPTRWSAGK